MTTTALGSIRARREGKGWTQQELADGIARAAWDQHRRQVGVNADMVSKWERAAKTPSPFYRRLLSAVLGTVAVSPAHSTHTFEPANDNGFDSPAEVAERMAWLASSPTSAEQLNALEGFIDVIVDDYETAGPSKLIGASTRRRRQIEHQLRTPQPPGRQQRLFRVAGRLSGLLGYMSVNLGRFKLADAYCAEAFALAGYADDLELQAWSRGTASLSAYYAGDYRAALATAQDGQRYARGGPQAIRLAINGEARALARLGDARGARNAVELAYTTASRCDTTPGITSCISFGPYGHARTAANAATVHVDLGDHAQVEQHAAAALPACEASKSVWSQSLIRLDVARSLIEIAHPQVERASALVSEALTISADRPITSVLQRSNDFLTSAARFGPIPELDQLTSTLDYVNSRE